MSSLVDSETGEVDQPNSYVYLRMYSGDGRGQEDRRGEMHLNLPLGPWDRDERQDGGVKVVIAKKKVTD